MPEDKREPEIDDSGSTHEHDDSNDSKYEQAVEEKKTYGGFESARPGARNEVGEASTKARDYEQENVDYDEQRPQPRPSRLSGVKARLKKTFEKPDRPDLRKMNHEERMKFMNERSEEMGAQVKLAKLAKERRALTTSRINDAISVIFPSGSGQQGKGKGRPGMQMFDTQKGFDQPNNFFFGGGAGGVNMAGIEAMYGIRKPKASTGQKRPYRKRKGRKGKRRDRDDDDDDRQSTSRRERPAQKRSSGMSVSEFYGI